LTSERLIFINTNLIFILEIKAVILSPLLRSTPECSRGRQNNSGALRNPPEIIPEEIPPESFRRRNFYSGGLRKSSGVFRSSVKSTPEPSGMFFPEDSGGSQN